MSEKVLKLGMIGSSKGNGHPYSWSAIFNGYDKNIIEACGFPLIPKYLNCQKFPDVQVKTAKVTHIWTQDINLSNHIASAVFIENIADDFNDLLKSVDAVLLARDDSENHLKFATPFLKAGIPIFIDKPMALKVSDAKKLFNLQSYEGQIFSCSAMKYSAELKLTDKQKKNVGKIISIHGFVPKSWDKYSVHIIEPTLQLIPNRGKIVKSKVWRNDDKVLLLATFNSGVQIQIESLGEAISPIALRIIGDKGWIDLIYSDTFNAFRSTLIDFIDGITNKDVRTPSKNIIEIIKLIELGRST